MGEDGEQPRSRRVLVIWMIVSQLLTVGSLVIWLIIAGLSVMAFDSGVTQEAWNIVIAVWAYPIIPIVLVIAAWIAFARRKNKLAGLLSGLSFTPPFLLYAVIWAANTVWAIQNGSEQEPPAPRCNLITSPLLNGSQGCFLC
jgi:cytochrome bd-type quinol oxidase subunit 2